MCEPLPSPMDPPAPLPRGKENGSWVILITNYGQHRWRPHPFFAVADPNLDPVISLQNSNHSLMASNMILGT